MRDKQIGIGSAKELWAEKVRLEQNSEPRSQMTLELQQLRSEESETSKTQRLLRCARSLLS